MSKRAFKKYIKTLKKKDLEEQLLDLYERFDEVRVYYNFVFNPNEDKLVKEAKFKISKEYFPVNSRKPKKRRSVAQKLVKHFLKLEMEPHSLTDVMLYNIEVAQAYSKDQERITEAFQKSMFKSFEQAVDFMIEKGISAEFTGRIRVIAEEAEAQNWENSYQFQRVLDRFL
ncbi:DUF6155 family protein [Gramella sp. GC03-9]|uniref:DUF6155 family protein n=1 Tax=Christiangramia oceanisediminis TaxID=2920386 RepID=A0A9X2R8I6_9FLAO|nr:DUF6155 family protein [Gramella oceanisediminis]MCP9200362.1 DUF6155 family protein [Gramella oceanisediminis]